MSDDKQIRDETPGTRGFAAYLAESLWLSVDAPQFIGGYAAEARPHEIFDSRGQPEAFRKECGKAKAFLFIAVLNVYQFLRSPGDALAAQRVEYRRTVHLPIPTR